MQFRSVRRQRMWLTRQRVLEVGIAAGHDEELLPAVPVMFLRPIVRIRHGTVSPEAPGFHTNLSPVLGAEWVSACTMESIEVRISRWSRVSVRSPYR